MDIKFVLGLSIIIWIVVYFFYRFITKKFETINKDIRYLDDCLKNIYENEYCDKLDRINYMINYHQTYRVKAEYYNILQDKHSKNIKTMCDRYLNQKIPEKIKDVLKFYKLKKIN